MHGINDLCGWVEFGDKFLAWFGPAKDILALSQRGDRILRKRAAKSVRRALARQFIIEAFDLDPDTDREVAELITILTTWLALNSGAEPLLRSGGTRHYGYVITPPEADSAVGAFHLVCGSDADVPTRILAAFQHA